MANKSIKGTQTEKNLLTSFAGESQARNRYTFFASAAKRKVMNKYQLYFWKQQNKKRNTQNVCSNSWKVEQWK